MKIRYTDYAPNPTLRGTETHLPAHRAQPLIDSGIAVEVKYTSYVERLTAEPGGMLTPDPDFVVGAQYSVHERMFGSVLIGHAYVTRRSGTETVFFDKLEAIPSDCPKNVVIRFLTLNAVGDPEVLAEKRIQEHYRQEAAAQKQNDAETGAAVAKYGVGVLKHE